MDYGRDRGRWFSSLIAIHPSFNKLLTALRTAVANEYKLDKGPHLMISGRV